MIDICPPGDTKEIVEDNIDFIEAHPCDVVFTATRTRGGSCKTLKEYAERKGAELIEVWKEYNDDLDEKGKSEANRKLAEKLFEKFGK